MIRRDLPYGGYLIEPPQVQFEETIVFVHHWGGHRSSMKPHMDWLNGLGFKTATFNQSFHSKKTLRWDFRLLSQPAKGLRGLWADEITKILNLISGPKILYTFSFPSGAALVSMGDRKAQDVSAWVCDGGPFVNLHKCFWNYFTHQTPISNWILREAAVLGSHVLFGQLQLKADFRRAFQRLPEGFPVLSIRGWQDPLVPSSAIDEAFALSSHLRLEKLSLPEGRHLDGLSKHPGEYKPRVERFLFEKARRLNPPMGQSTEATPHPLK